MCSVPQNIIDESIHFSCGRYLPCFFFTFYFVSHRHVIAHNVIQGTTFEYTFKKHVQMIKWLTYFRFSKTWILSLKCFGGKNQVSVSTPKRKLLDRITVWQRFASSKAREIKLQMTQRQDCQTWGVVLILNPYRFLKITSCQICIAPLWCGSEALGCLLHSSRV